VLFRHFSVGTEEKQRRSSVRTIRDLPNGNEEFSPLDRELWAFAEQNAR
jgi:hypothetical protein